MKLGASATPAFSPLPQSMTPHFLFSLSFDFSSNTGSISSAFFKKAVITTKSGRC